MGILKNSKSLSNKIEINKNSPSLLILELYKQNKLTKLDVYNMLIELGLMRAPSVIEVDSISDRELKEFNNVTFIIKQRKV